MNISLQKPPTTQVLSKSSDASLDFDQIHPLVAALDFTRLKWKLVHSKEATFSEEEAELAELEYRRFLTLKVHYPKVSLVPSKLIDKFWHAHILDTMAYAADCQMVFGFFLHHYPYFGIYGEEDQSELQNSFEQTNALYEKHFTRPYVVDTSDMRAARCEGHPCHAPTSCACREPGACK